MYEKLRINHFLVLYYKQFVFNCTQQNNSDMKLCKWSGLFDGFCGVMVVNKYQFVKPAY